MASADTDNVITPMHSDRDANNKRQLKIFLKPKQEDQKPTATDRYLQPFANQFKQSSSSQQIVAPTTQAAASNSSMLQKSSLNISNQNIMTVLPNLKPSSPNQRNKLKGKFSWRDPSPASVDVNTSKNRDAATMRQEKDTPQVSLKFDLKRRLRDNPEEQHSREKRLPTTREELDSSSPTTKQHTEEESTGIPVNKRPEIKWVGESWPDIYQEIEFTKVIGQGSFAKVYSAIDLQTRQRVAVKVIDKRKVGEINCRKMVDKELEVVSALDHPNIVKFHRLIEDKKRVGLLHADLLRHGDVWPLHAQPVLPCQELEEAFGARGFPPLHPAARCSQVPAQQRRVPP